VWSAATEFTSSSLIQGEKAVSASLRTITNTAELGVIGTTAAKVAAFTLLGEYVTPERKEAMQSGIDILKEVDALC
jgi:hypothetical protein